jgi:hypothetical protein
MIKAKRNGLVSTFHPKTWDLLPHHKYGWVPVPHDPPTSIAQIAQPVLKTKKPRTKKARAIEL